MKPDIFWIITDEHRSDGVGAFGNSWIKTPHLDRLASEGVIFNQCYCQTPTCAASRPAMLSGKYPHTLGNLWFDWLDENERFFTEVLAEHGYHTANIGKEDHHRKPNSAFQMSREIKMPEGDSFGMPEPWCNQEKELGILRRYTTTHKQIVIGGTSPLPPEKGEAAVVVNESIDYLKKFDRSSPILFRSSIIFPHTPVLPPVPYNTMYNPDDMVFGGDLLEQKGTHEFERVFLQEAFGVAEMKPEHIRKMRADYFGLCSYVDSEIGRLLNWLRENWDRPYYVIFNSDHGNSLGEHGLHEKFNLYDVSLRVPLIITGPGIEAGRRVEHPVELTCLAPTVLDMAGIDRRELEMEVSDFFDTEAQGDDPCAFFEYEPRKKGIQKGIRTARHFMSMTPVWREECDDLPNGALFDCEKDPYQMNNLFNDPEQREVRNGLVRRLREWDAGGREEIDETMSKLEPAYAAVE